MRRWKREWGSSASKAALSAWLKAVSEQVDRNAVGQGVELSRPSLSRIGPTGQDGTAVGGHALDADGISKVVSHVEPGWGFRCVCGWQSPIFPTADHARLAFSDHARSEAAPKLWKWHARTPDS